MSRLSEREKLRRIKQVLYCLNSQISKKGFDGCLGMACGEYRVLCGIIRKEIAEYYHLSDDLQEAC